MLVVLVFLFGAVKPDNENGFVLVKSVYRLLFFIVSTQLCSNGRTVIGAVFEGQVPARSTCVENP